MYLEYKYKKNFSNFQKNRYRVHAKNHSYINHPLPSLWEITFIWVIFLSKSGDGTYCTSCAANAVGKIKLHSMTFCHWKVRSAPMARDAHMAGSVFCRRLVRSQDIPQNQQVANNLLWSGTHKSRGILLPANVYAGCLMSEEEIKSLEDWRL